jgi:hypothetical protein
MLSFKYFGGYMMKKLIIIVNLILMSAGISNAMFSKDDSGTASAQFLKLGVGARAAALGESYVAVSDDATAIYWNPAGLNNVGGRELSVMHAVWFEDIFYDWASYVQDCKLGGKIGVGVQYLSYGSITETDSTGLEGTDFTPYDIAAILSYAREINGISLGVNIKYISSKIEDESAWAVAADVGSIYKMCDKLSLGLVVQNIGTKMKYIDEEEDLPLNIKAGVAYKLMESLLVTADVNAPADGEIIMSGGGEYCHSVNENLSASVRAGYNTRNKDTGDLNGIAAGAGIKYQKYNLDYAYAPYGDLGNTHRVSLGVKF